MLGEGLVAVRAAGQGFLIEAPIPKLVPPFHPSLVQWGGVEGWDGEFCPAPFTEEGVGELPGGLGGADDLRRDAGGIG